MPQEIQPALALEHIEEIVFALHGELWMYEPDVQARIREAYATMRAEYPVDGNSYQQGEVVRRFLEAIVALPEVVSKLGDLLDATRGPVRRGLGGSAVPLLDRLPPLLDPPLPQAAPPPEDMPSIPAPAPSMPFPGDFERARRSAVAPPTRGEPVGEAAPPESMPAGSDAPASATPTLTRFPHIECPEQAIVNQKLSVFVQLLIEQAATTGAAMQIEDAGDAPPELELVLRAPGCDIEGSNTRTLMVERDMDAEERFVLVPRRLGQQTIRVDFYQHGRRIGTERHVLLVVEQPQAVEVQQPQSTGNLDITRQPVIPPPDLELCIEVDERDGRTLIFTLHSSSEQIGYNHAKMGKVTLQGSPLEKMQSVYAEMSRMARATPATADEQRLAEMRLASVGSELWKELLPDELKRQYWRFRSRVKTILITSDEPWVPWEMLKPHRVTDDGDTEEDPFWCQRFAVARWLSGPCAADQLPLGQVRPVAPATVNLAAVREEVAFIEQLGTLRHEMVPLGAFSQRLQVLDWLKTGGFSVLHFACHGQFDATVPNDSAISLGDGPLRPSDIRAHFGKGPRPLIFINACHGGRMDLSFTGLGGWADRLVKDACVGAFVGAQWEVNDALALQFARRFYTALLKEQAPIATAFQIAREDIRQAAPGNSTWLAYVLYADPLARVQAG